MHTEKRPLWLRALLTAGFLVLCAAWLFLAVVLWDGGKLSWGGTAIYPKTGTLPIVRNLPSGAFLADLPSRFRDWDGKAALLIYLCLFPLPCWAFALTALLPDTLRRFFPGSRKLRFGYGIVAALGVVFGLLCTLAGCTTLLRGLLSFSAEQSLARIHMLLIPISGALAVLGWLLPCAAHRLLELGGGRALLREAGGGARPPACCWPPSSPWRLRRCALWMAFAQITPSMTQRLSSPSAWRR